MAEKVQVFGSGSTAHVAASPPGCPCIMVIFGASGDLTKRLLMPAIFNLACDGLLPENFAIIGSAMDPMTTDQFRERMTGDIKKFNTRTDFDETIWKELCSRLYYTPGKFDDLAAFERLAAIVKKLDGEHKTGGNVLFYFAVPPWAFGLISTNLDKTGFRTGDGWRRIIVEKPFGTDLESARKLNKEILSYWDESQIYRVDHYLGKETVQNLLAFRFSNGMYEPMWNKNFVDHIQLNVTEVVDVEGRGAYYDTSGVLRDMMQNHMFQMLSYLCMEPPSSFQPDDVRNEKAKILHAVRVMKPEEVPEYTVRGQYGPSVDDQGNVVKPGYRQEPGVKPDSKTETFAAYKMFIDNWRWDGVPIYFRSGKGLWKRGTEIVVQFKKAPLPIFRGTKVDKLSANRIVFHVQPRQAIETLFQAKVPGPTMQLQTVHMRFDYGESFKAARYTGYEVMIYSCMHGDATLFSRTDFVEAAWRVAQPMLDYWSSTPATEFPNYVRGTWGPKSASDLIEKDGRRWFEVITTEVLEKCDLFKGADSVFLNALVMALRPAVASQGETIIKKGDIAHEMYLLVRGDVEVIDGTGKVVATIKDGGFFGEIGILMSQPRMATVRAKSLCDLFVLEKEDFNRILREQPQFAERIMKVAKERYNLAVGADQLMGKPKE
jgi:glucose-6-phosphate 1-dehydrogenase